MSREQLYVKLNEVFREVFDDQSIIVSDMTTANDIERWDSLMHINLLFAIENAFEIRFDIEEGLILQNVGEMADIILRKCNDN
ncbi:acyl carrier protein [bacterium 1xD8-6]|nr:acyl carrier protein [bacterium D16-36]RKI69577.1 acyl carrier protein [bacterium 1xD8-6]